MANKEFIYPSQFQDIELETDTRYWVDNVDNIATMDERRQLRQLKEIESALYQDIHIIAEPERFDFCYFFIKFLQKKQDQISLNCLKTCCDLLQTGLSRIIEKVEDIEEKEEEMSKNEMFQIRNTFKMWLFLNQYFLSSTCVRKGKNSIEDQLANAMLGNDNKNKKAGRGNKKQDLSNEYINILLEKQKEIIECLQVVPTIDVQLLWQGKPIDTEFFKFMAEIAIKMLESRQLLKKYESVKDIIFQILETTFKIQPDTNRNVQVKLMSLIYEDENLVDNVVDFACKAQESQDPNLQNLTTEIAILITNYANQQKYNPNAESQNQKNTKQFLIKIAEKYPKIFNTNLSVFIKLYDNEGYHLRNAITEIIGRIIMNVLTIKEDEEEEEQSQNHLKQKKKLFETLIKRIYDKHAYCRSYVLTVLCELCDQNTIPSDQLQNILICGCDRVKDQSANVRKKAINLIQSALKIYYMHYVEDGKGQKGFVDISNIKKDIKTIEMDKREFNQGIQEIEENIDQLGEGDDEIFEQLKEKKQMLKKKIEHCNISVEKLQEYFGFLDTIEGIIPSLTQLLGSKNIGDVQESIKLFLYLHKTGFKSAYKGIQKMLVLIWSREKQIKEELIKTYWNLFLNDAEFKRQQVAKNIIHIFKDASLSDITSLEEMLKYIIDWNHNLDDKDKEKKKNLFYIHTETFQHIWSYFKVLLEQKSLEDQDDFDEEEDNQQICLQKKNQKIKEMRSSLCILRICIPYKKNLFNSDKLLSLIEILKGFLKSNRPDWIIVKEISQITQSLTDIKQDYKIMFIRLLMFILIKFQGTEDNEWYIATESILNMIFAVQPQPDGLCQFLILKLTRNLISQEDQQKFQVNTQNEFPQSQYAPQTPLKQSQNNLQRNIERTPANFADLLVQQEGNNDQQQLQQGYLFQRKLSHLLFVVGHTALKLILLVDNIETQLKKLKIEGENKNDQKNQQNDEENNELDKVYGGLEAEFEKEKEKLHNISEQTIVQGDNLLAQYKPWILRIVQDMIELQNDNSVQRDINLDRVAVLALCKFMCSSQKFCKQNLGLLFKILSNEQIDEIIKTNVIITLGDLLHKYQNLIAPYIDKVYENLHDSNLQVRKTTMMVLTHLILNDMMKIKGEICEVALLLEDNNENIQNLVKLFLHELHKKDPKLIYNMLPEAIGRMSNENKTKLGAKITDQSFILFAKNIMPYLEKGSETLIEKLLNRLETKNVREQINVSYCLSQLSFNDKGVRLLLDYFEKYRLLLDNSQINNNFQQILLKLKKFSKPEIKTLIDELEEKLTHFNQETFDAKRVEQKKKKNRNASKKRGGKKANSDDDSSEDNDDKPKQRKGRSATQSKKKKGSKNRMVLEDDDEEDESEDSFIDDDEFDDSEASNSSNSSNKKQKSKKKQKLVKGGKKQQQKKKMSEIIEEDEEEDDDFQRVNPKSRRGNKNTKKKVMDIEEEDDNGDESY